MKLFDTVFVIAFILVILISGWLGWTYNEGHNPYLTSFFSMLGFSMIYMLIMQHVDEYVRSTILVKN